MDETLAGSTRAPKLLGGFGLGTLLAGVLLLAGSILFLKAAAEPHAYSVYLACHVIAATVWVGGAVTMTLLGIVFERRGDNEMLAAIGRMGSWVGPRVYTPATFAVLGFGLAMMLEADLDWGQFWIVFALAGWSTTAFVGLFLIGPTVGRINRAVREHGPDSDQATRWIRRLYLIARLDAVVLVLIVLDMTAKPFA